MKVLKIEGIEALVEHIIAVAKLPASQGMELSKAFKNNSGSLSSQSQNYTPFPEAAIGVGESWQSQSAQSAIAPILISTQYTLLSHQNKRAVLSLRSKIFSNPKVAPMKINSETIDYKLSGAQNGVMYLDEVSGLTREAEIHQRISGRVTLAPIQPSKLHPENSGMIYIKSTIRLWTNAPPRQAAP